MHYSVSFFEKKKRGQLTLFIIIGLVVIATFVTVMLIKNTIDTGKMDSTINKQKSAFAREEVQNFGDSCLKNGIARLANSQEGVVWKFGEGFESTYPISSFRAERATIPNAASLETEFSAIALDEFANCMDLEALSERTGYTILPSAPPSSAVAIGDDSISLTMSYPLKASKELKVDEISDFKANIPIRLGTALKVANFIATQAANAGSTFDLASQCSQICSLGQNKVLAFNVVTSPTQSKIKVIDYVSMDNSFQKSYVFNFMINKRVTGECSTCP
jgi:hypothetical protein